MSDASVFHPKISLNDFIFGYTKEYIDRILPFDENVCYSEDPFINIVEIAKKVGIKDVYYVSFLDIEKIAKKYQIKNVRSVLPEDFSNKHAVLIEVNKEYIILVNKFKNKDEQRFSIAHEIEHFISKKTEKNLSSYEKYLPSSFIAQAIAGLYIYYISKTNNRTIPKLAHLPCKIDIKALIDYFPNETNTIKSRSDYLSQLKNLKKNKNYKNEIITRMKARSFSKLIASDISLTLNKPISETKTYAVLYKHLKLVNKKMSVKTALHNTIAEIIEEEIADYFAANLLVPIELFALWEDKSDNKIAQAFGVPKKCIKKRRKYEVEHETDYITSEFLTFSRNTNTSVPITQNEKKHITGGHNIHDPGRG